MRSTAGLLLLLALALLAFGFQGSIKGMTPRGSIPSRTHGSVCGHSSEGGAVLRCEKWRTPYGGRAPAGAEQKQAAESSAALHGFIYALHHPPLSFSLLCSDEW
jgi:hypothetical protein